MHVLHINDLFFLNLFVRAIEAIMKPYLVACLAHACDLGLGFFLLSCDSPFISFHLFILLLLAELIITLEPFKTQP